MSERAVRRMRSRTVFGLLIIVLGVVLTLSNLGLIHLGAVLAHWPVILIVLGLGRLPRSPTGGLVLILLGAAFLAPRYFPDFDLGKLWPLVLVLLGLSLVARSFGAKRRRRRRADSAVDSADAVHLVSFFNARRRRITSQEFRGGELTAILGGCDLDLREARLAGGEATIDVAAIWGGIGVRVPEDWNVSLRVTPIMGGADDSRSRDLAPPAAGAARPHVILKGFALMGGVEVRG